MKPTTRPQFLIAAPASGTGKTTLSMGLMKILARKEMKVQPFKCGPDYIDIRFHEIAAGSPSVNLDTFMASEEHVRQIYARYSQTADVCIAEGMMGLFDGYDGRKGSAADIARLLNLPVILVVDAQSTAYSVAAQIYGFKNFDPHLQTVGIIFNRVGSERHETMLRKACRDIDVPCLGCIRRNEALHLQSRYLGLDISPEENEQVIEAWADCIEGQIDLDLLLDQTMRPIPVYNHTEVLSNKKKLRIAVARNKESFAFMYEETLARFRKWGEVIFFDPEKTPHLPHSIDILYLPGGYPEKRMRQVLCAAEDIKKYIEDGGRTIAECGGMIYLSKGIEDESGFNAMADVLPFGITNANGQRRLTLGYRQFEYNGQKLRGHEFHYTQIQDDPIRMPSVAQVYNAIGQPVSTPVFRYKNLIASYTHLYLGETDMLQLWNDGNTNS